MTIDTRKKKFLFVVGKGGVGKTTVSIALALSAARQGRRVLIAMPNAKERLSLLMNSEPIGPEITEIADGVSAVNITPDSALEEYGMMILKVKALYQAVFGNRFVRAFLSGTPGLEAWSMLGKAYNHAVGHGPKGEGDFDLVIMDAPATGHGLDMLRVPQVISEVAPPGLLRREALRALSLFRDPERGGVVLVTLPEDMPVNETLELRDAVTQELGMPISAVVTNGLVSPVFLKDERTAFVELPSALSSDSPLQPLAKAGRTRATRERVQSQSVKKLLAGLDSRGESAPHVQLPFLFSTDFGAEQVKALSRAFD